MGDKQPQSYWSCSSAKGFNRKYSPHSFGYRRGKPMCLPFYAGQKRRSASTIPYLKTGSFKRSFFLSVKRFYQTISSDFLAKGMATSGSPLTWQVSRVLPTARACPRRVSTSLSPIPRVPASSKITGLSSRTVTRG